MSVLRRMFPFGVMPCGYYALRVLTLWVPITIVACVILFGQSNSASAQGSTISPEYTRYIHLLHGKQYRAAINLAFEAAEKRQGWAENEVADLYNSLIRPQPTSPELTEVMSLVMDRLELAEKNGDAHAQYVLGVRLLYQEPSNSNLAKAVALLNKAADQGHQGAIFTLSGMDRKALAAKGITSKYAKEY